MKTTNIKQIFALAAISAAATSVFAATTYKYEPSTAQNIDWKDIVWNPTPGAPTTGDTFEININNAVANAYLNNDAALASYFIDDGANSRYELSVDRFYLRKNTKFYIGDENDTYETVIRTTGNTSEVQDSSTLYIQKNGTLILDNNKSFQVWSRTVVGGGVYTPALVVDGGKFKGNISMNNADYTEYVFQNEGAYYKGRNNDCLTNHNTGRVSRIIFDNATYYGFNDWDGDTYAFGGNAFYFTLKGGETYATAGVSQNDVTFKNGAVLNGAGVTSVVGGVNTVTYYDFSGDASKLISGINLNFYINRLYLDDNYFRFSILNGSKVSASGMTFGNAGDMEGGKLFFNVKGNDASSVSYFATSGGISLAISNKYIYDSATQTFTPVANNKFESHIDYEGFSNIFVKGGYSVGSNETLAGKSISRIVGDSNTIYVGGDTHLNAGQDNGGTRDIGGGVKIPVNLGSVAEIEFYFGKDANGNIATNSSWETGNFNIYSGFATKIDAVFAGSTNKLTTRNGFNVNASKYANGTSVANITFTDGIDAKISGTFNLGNNESNSGTIIGSVLGNGTKLAVTGNFNLNAGQNTETSTTDVQFYFGKDAAGNVATNASFSSADINLYTGGQAKILAVFDGQRNTGTTASNTMTYNNMYIYGSNYANGTGESKIVLTNGIKKTGSTSVYLDARMSGNLSFELSNKSSMSIANFDFRNGTTGSTSNLSAVIDSSIFTSTGVINYNIGNAAAGTNSFTIQGKNSDITINEIRMTVNYTYADTTHKDIFNVLGEGNYVTINNLNISSTNVLNGNSNFYAKGTNANNKNELLIGGEAIALHGQTDASSKAVANITLAGNTILGRKENEQDRALVLKINEHNGYNFKAGINTFTVTGTGNELHLQGLIIGNTISEGGQGRFVVDGGGSEISVINEFKVRGARDLANPTDRSQQTAAGVARSDVGKLVYKMGDTTEVDASGYNKGISFIDVYGSNAYEFTGILEIDLSGIKTNFEGQTQSYLLMIGGNGFKDALSKYWFDFDAAKEYAENVKVITRDASDIYEFEITGSGSDGWSLVMTYTSTVPEPAAYAAIFGALALGFAVYRKKKNAKKN